MNTKLLSLPYLYLQCSWPTWCYSPRSLRVHFQGMWIQKYGCKHLKTSSPSILPRNYIVPQSSSACPYHSHNSWRCWIEQLNARSLKIRKRNQTATLRPLWATIKTNIMMPWLSVSFYFARNKRKIKLITVNYITVAPTL